MNGFSKCGALQGLFSFDLVDHFERPQLFHLNTEIVIKRVFSVILGLLCRKDLLYFERRWEEFWRPFRSLETS